MTRLFLRTFFAGWDPLIDGAALARLSHHGKLTLSTVGDLLQNVILCDELNFCFQLR